MFARVPPAALVRVLSGGESAADCLALIRALPLADFARAALFCALGSRARA